jgi:predicted permease
MLSLWQDLRYAVRMLAKSPGFTAVAVITLALGIGGNTAIFTLVNAVMLQSIPVRHPKELVVLQQSARALPENIYDISGYGDCGGCSFSSEMYRQLQARNDLFSGVLAMAGPEALDLSGNGTASIVRSEFVSGNYFQVLDVSAVIGRTLEPLDDRPGAGPVAVLSYPYWQRVFGGAPNIIGKTIHLNGFLFTIAGVIDPRFTRLTPGKSQDLWLPLSSADVLRPNLTGGPMNEAGSWWLTLVARLKPEWSVAQAQAAVNLIYRNDVLYGAKPFFKEQDDPRIVLLPVQKGLVGIRESYARPLFILTAVVGIVLLIACANIAGLLLARATTREKEIAVRLALGAGPKRIFQQLLTESVLLSVAGAAFGILFANWGAEALASFISNNADSPIVINARPDAMVLVSTAGMALFTGILFGLAPAFRGCRINVAPALKENAATSVALKSPGRRFGLGSSLVIAQVGLSVVVLISASLLVRTLGNLRSVDPGFDTRNLLLFGIDPRQADYKGDRTQALYSELHKRLASIPGVISSTYSNIPFLRSDAWTGHVHIEGQLEKPAPEINMLAAGPDFFETMRIPIVAGRTFSAYDLQSGRPVAIVNQHFARRFLQGGNPLGAHFATGGDGNQVQREIIGVVADAKYDDLRKPVEATVYIPFEEGRGRAFFALRTSTRPEAMIPTVRRVVAGLDDNLPLFDVRTQTEVIDHLLFNERLVARLSALFGVLAFVLACMGLYGLLSYEVARRTREIGIRTALGAQERDVLRLVVGRGIALVAVGEVAGIAGAFGLTRYLQSLLYGVRPTDPATFIGVVLLLGAVSLAACYIPARRATKVDPMVALRYE